MDRLQGELRSTYPILNIQIIGINEFGENPSGANELATANRTLPWLQDVDRNSNLASDVWSESWHATWRDVIILNGQNETVEVFNLTSNNLGVAATYATMREKLIDAAMAEQKPWQNHRDRFDINDDGFVVPGDVLMMINELNDNGALKLLPPTGTSLAAPYWDSNGDNFFSPVDILQVINFFEGAAAEGEASGLSSTMAAPMIGAGSTTAFESSIKFDTPATVEIPAAPESSDDGTIPVQVSQSGEPIDERFRRTELNEDDFWATYWPTP